MYIYINAQDIGVLQVASKKTITAHIPIQGLCRFLKTKSWHISFHSRTSEEWESKVFSSF